MDASSAQRVQVAAVAAQQAGLDEEEVRLRQLAAHLENQAKELALWHDRLQADHAAHVQACQDLRFEQERVKTLEAQYTARLREINGQSELDRRRLEEAWDHLRQAQESWRQRRSRELAVLKERRREIEQVERRLVEARRLTQAEEEAGQQRKSQLERELEGLEQRIQNQRRKFQELTRPEPEPVRVPVVLAGKNKRRRAEAAGAAGAEENPAPTQRLEEWADALADQRLLLLEFCERLVASQRAWLDEHRLAQEELESAAHHLAEQDRQIRQRALDQEQAEQHLHQHEAELRDQQQRLAAWQSRLRLREEEWDSQRAALLVEVQEREAWAEEQLRRLVELRERWLERRRQEIEDYQKDRADWTRFRAAHAELLRQLQDQGSSPDLPRLFEELEQRSEKLLDRAADLAQAEADFADRLLAFEQNQARLSRHEHLERTWATQRQLLEQQGQRLREEIDQLIGNLLKDGPGWPLDRAA